MTTLYYVTGTGNSLRAALDLAEVLGDAQVLPLVDYVDPRVALPPSGAIGLVFPVVIWGLPPVVRRFVGRLGADQQSAYLFAVATNGGRVAGTLKLLARAVASRKLVLAAGFSAVMPTSFIVRNEPPTDRAFDAWDAQKSSLADQVRRKEASPVATGPKFDVRVRTGIINRLLSPLIPTMGQGFRAGAGCNGCGLCTRVCPVKNVSLKSGKPVWHWHCEACFGCLNLCPKASIEYHGLTTGKPRYRNPRVTVTELAHR